MAYIVGEGADMAMVDCHASHDHGCYEGKKVLRPVPKSENEQFSNTFFSEGNGGESRKSFHGYPNGYAQLISSPKEFHLEPMQIDTWNRDNPSLEFVAGPEPAASQAPPGASYSGILECPCTDRISKVNGSICSDDFGCLPFNLACLEEPGSTLISNGNKICNLDTYNGGQQCCPHQSILLDRDQNPWPDVKQTYRLKFRFYYQAYVPTADRVSASHQDLRRLYWQTEAWAGEYDIPPGAESYGHDDGATAMTDDGQYTYTITSEWTAGEMIDLDDCDWRNTSACSGQYKDSEGVYMVYAGGHCHAPNCVSIELWNQDTGELYCRQLPMFGKGDITNDKFDDKGYATLPPCVWSDDASEDLPTRPRVPFDAKLYSVAVQNSTYGSVPKLSLFFDFIELCYFKDRISSTIYHTHLTGASLTLPSHPPTPRHPVVSLRRYSHTGQMASWQMRGALYY
mmetsp:Transcript_61941/g.170570  ORF Transcript_61941/g.170570 Transcript_61941/m.170570 type:complete len:455 (-) Transcript_61941:351-1715(-)